MNKLIEFNVAGGRVLVESQEAVTGSTVRGASFAQIAEKVDQSLEDTLVVIRAVAEVGAVIAHASTEGSLHIKFAWKPT